MNTPVLVVGRGQLARELLAGLPRLLSRPVQAWGHRGPTAGPSIVVHAGSGQALPEVWALCAATNSPLLELATGGALPPGVPSFPLVRCPNTNVLMLKFMHMLARSGPLFAGCRIEITESHQAAKTSVPGTAVAIAHALGVSASSIRSVRDREQQRRDWQLADGDLERHAMHRITIDDGTCRITMQTRVSGEAPYAQGVARIIEATAARALAPGLHDIDTFVAQGWI